MAFLLCCSLAPLVARLVVLTDVARQSETHENVFQKKGFATGTHLVARIEIKLRIPLLQRNATANDAGEAPQYRGENQCFNIISNNPVATRCMSKSWTGQRRSRGVVSAMEDVAILNFSR